MAPKKAKKIPLGEFLVDSTLGSWADEMDALPNAPATRTEDDQGRPGDRYGRRDDFLSSRPDRGAPPRDDVPLPTQPPYTAFIGNLAFDLTELELEEFFAPAKAKSVKIIRDREDKPKGFGYIEFEELDGLKDAISKSGSNLSNRNIRVSVAEPPKERTQHGGSGGGFDDDAKFDSPWRRDGPLPDSGHSRDSSRRRFDGPSADRGSSVAEGVSDWRSSRPARPSVPDVEPIRRRGSGFSTPEGQPSAADQADVWTKGAKFTPTTSTDEKFGSTRGKSDMGPPKDVPTDESDWRSGAKPRSNVQSGVSPTNSTPPTPQMGRKKLELLPRSGGASVSPSPLSSPKMGPTPAAAQSISRASPFGAAKPVDVTNKEKEVAERLDKEREIVKERLTMSRTNSRTASERSPLVSTRTPPPTAGPHAPTSPKIPNATVQPKPSLGPNVRPTLSFANAAARKEGVIERIAPQMEQNKDRAGVEDITEKVAEVAV